MRKLLLAALTVTVLAACGTTEPTPVAAPTAPAAPVSTAKVPEAPAQPTATAPATPAPAPAPATTAAVTPPATSTPAPAAAPTEAAPSAQPTATTAVAVTGEATAKPAETTAAAADSKPAEAEKAALPDVVHATIHLPAGDIHVSLFHKTAPLSVENFVKLARSKFFDGLSFHRVEPGFVVQGGDPNTREGATGIPGTGGPGYTIPAENGPANTEKHLPGTLGMADSGLGTAGSQFYITLAATPHLDGRYTVFGRVVGDKDLAVASQIKKGDRFTVTIDDDAK